MLSQKTTLNREMKTNFTSSIFSTLSDMMPWMMPYLRYVDDSLKSSFQESLSLMRKNRLFCDVILHVSLHLHSTSEPANKSHLNLSSG